MNLIKKIIKETIREYLNETTKQKLLNLKPKLVLAAQQVYDNWEQNEEGYCDSLGQGGICQDIASAMVGVLDKNDIESATVSQTIGEQHVYVVAKTEDGIYEVDIPPYVYETGGGYCWKKIPNVKFDEKDVIINRLSSDPDEFENYIGDW
jgi:hypothetical protein